MPGRIASCEEVGRDGKRRRKDRADGCPGLLRTHKRSKEVRKERGYPDAGIYAGNMQFFFKIICSFEIKAVNSQSITKPGTPLRKRYSF
ncbi:hypothetical protein C3V43_13325 [Bacteroides heparinolyticus]|nr:hypothetical protein C3V43_13325 [Bacteroides heparinolyticus]